MDELGKRLENLTVLLKAFTDGDTRAMDELMPLIYEELRVQAHLYLSKERKNHTLQTTALVHEAYLRLIKQNSVNWQNRAHFFGMSATMMRRILVNYARNRNRLKRGGKNENLPLDEIVLVTTEERDIDLLALDRALNELNRLDEKQSRIVELRYFGGLTINETAEVLKISPTSVKRGWKVAKTWLQAELRAGAKE